MLFRSSLKWIAGVTLVLIHAIVSLEGKYKGKVDRKARHSIERPISLYLGSLPR